MDHLKKLHTDPEPENGEENAEVTIARSCPVVTPWMPRQDTLILLTKMHMQMNCQIRQRQLRLKLHQEVILNVIHLEFVILLTASASDTLGIGDLYHL